MNNKDCRKDVITSFKDYVMVHTSETRYPMGVHMINQCFLLSFVFASYIFAED